MVVHELSDSRILSFKQSRILGTGMYPRFVEHRVHEALADTRAVLLCGPRQSGKTMLARQIASDDTPFFTLDDSTVLEAALSDPVGFVRGCAVLTGQ